MSIILLNSAKREVAITKVITSLSSSVVFSSLPTEFKKGFILEAMIKRSGTGQYSCDLLVNGDTSLGKYSMRMITFTSTSGSPSVWGASNATGAAYVYSDGAPGGTSGAIVGFTTKCLICGNTAILTSNPGLSASSAFGAFEGRYVHTSDISLTSISLVGSAAFMDIGSTFTIRPI